MIPLRMTPQQRKKIGEMKKEFFPNAFVGTLDWFEFCFRGLAPKIAENYAKHHVGTTESFAKFAIVQKLAMSLEKEHPIDLLYDMWKNPKDYRVDL